MINLVGNFYIYKLTRFRVFNKKTLKLSATYSADWTIPENGSNQDEY